MLAHIQVSDLIFIDIETVPMFSTFDALNTRMQELWEAKHAQFKFEDETYQEGYLKRAGVYAEFAKVVCISIGYFHTDRTSQQRTFRVKSFYGDDEKKVLEQFIEQLNKSFDQTRFHFCGHNIREFDIPFICRRLLIHRIKFPDILDVSGRRPWEMNNVDTLQLWKFGDYKNYTSLKLLSEVLDIPTPKEEIEGKDVCRVYWQEKGLQRIVEYCQRDVVTVARLLLRFKGEVELLTDEHIVFVN